MKLRWILASLLLIGILLIPYQSITTNPLRLQHAQAGSTANLFVSAENSQFNNYFAGPQVIQVVVADPDINRLDQVYSEPVVTVNGKRLRMAQATDGNWYAYFADRNQAIAADKTVGLSGKGLDFGMFCNSTSSFHPKLGVDFSETKGFTIARLGDFGSVDKPGNPSAFGSCQGYTANGPKVTHVIREEKTLNTNPAGFNAPYNYTQAWPIIQLYDFSGFPTTVTVDYEKTDGDQITNLTFDRIPVNLVSSSIDRKAYTANTQVFVTLNDPQLNIDPTEEDSWTWGSSSVNFGILASTYANSAPGTSIGGDLGYAAGPAIAATVDGIIHVADSVYSQTGIDQGITLAFLNAQACTTTFPAGPIDLATDATHGPIGVYTPGVYCSPGVQSIGVGGITLNGAGTYVFRSTGALNTVAGSHVTLSGGADASNVFWTPTGATTLGANSVFVGTDIDPSGITIGSTVTWIGRALAFGGTVSTSFDIIAAPSHAPMPPVILGNNISLYYQAFDRNGNKDADGTAGMQDLIGNLTTFMFNHNGKLTINPKTTGTRVIDFQSNGKQILFPTRDDPSVVHTESISSGSQPITFVEVGGVDSDVFTNGDNSGKTNIVTVNNNSIMGQNATVIYNGVSQNISGGSEHGSITDPYHIFLKAANFTPTPGLNIAAIKDNHTDGDTVHFLLQFTKIPNISDKSYLAERGINLIDYVTGNTYIASSKFSDLDNLNATAVPNAKWAGPLFSDLKISPILNTNNLNNLPTWAIVPPSIIGQNATYAIVTISLNKDANMTDTLSAISKIPIGGIIIANNTIIPSITALVNFTKINDIAKIDSVQFVDAVDPPLVAANDFVRNTTNVEVLHQNPYYNLKGAGVTALVYDDGPISGEQSDLESRVVAREDPNYTIWNEHATHVAGILGGDGRNSNGKSSINGFSNGDKPFQWAGMAPQVNLLSFWFNPTQASSPQFISGTPPSPPAGNVPLFNDEGDMIRDFTQALTHHPDLASMSLATNAAHRSSAQSYFGIYSATSVLVDNIVNGSAFNPPHPLLFFLAAGNNRGVNASWVNGTIDSPATAKNSIAVGAINSNDYSMTSFSSWGPTSDFRLKPDIVAPGSGIDHVKSTGNYNDYVEKWGTSQATPAAAGAAALLIQEWKGDHLWAMPAPHTVKAILIHTATELGDKIGPNYQSGFGALNAKFAIDLVRDDTNPKNPLIHTGSVILNATQSFTFTSDGQDDVKATLVWDDPSGAPISGGLKNDLDLRLQDPSGITYNPLVLDPTDPLATAKPGIDNKNNVEMAIGLARNGIWTATVNGTAITSSNSQDYTVIISKMYKRTTNTSLIADIHGRTGTVIAIVSDTDSGTPVPLKGNVTFGDGHEGIFTNKICVQQRSNLVCSADYAQESWLWAFPINAKYSGDPAHKASSDSTPDTIYCLLLIILIIILIIIISIAAVILYDSLR